MPESPRFAEDRSRWIVLVAATAIAVYLCWRMLQPFLSVVLWSSMLALLFSPVQRRLARRLPASLAATLTLLLVLATVIVPLGAVTGALVNEISEFVGTAPERLKRLLDDPAYGGRIQQGLDLLDQHFDLRKNLTREALQEHLGGAGQSLVKGTFNVLGGALGALVNLAFILFALFFLLRDGERFLAAVRGYLPLAPAESDQMFERTREIIQASVNGVLLIAALQGLMGGLAFAVLGLPSALLWGVVMMLLSILPMVGAGLIWLPAALLLVAQGAYGKAIVLVLWGALAIGSVDNFLRPRLVGQRARMHELVIFFAVLGGLRVFGVLGLFFGPVVVAVTTSLFEVFRRGGGSGQRPDATPQPSVPPAADPPPV